MSNTKELLKLIAENPNLPVIPLVAYEVVGDDSGKWVGSFGFSYVGEYTLYNDCFYDDREDFKEAYFNYNSEDLCKQFDLNPFDKKTSKAMENIEKYLNEIADRQFIKAILVNIYPPD